MSVLPAKYRRRSALQAFACPAHFKGYYVDGLPNDSQPARRGTAFHEVFRRYVRLLVEHQCSDDLDLARQAFREGAAAAMVSLDVIAEVDEIWSRFVPTFELDVDTVLMNEERPDDEYSWQPDLVRVYPGDILEITDLKTHFAILSEDAARDAFQCKFYSARARRVWPNFKIYRFSLWFVRWGVMVLVELTQDDIDRHEEQLAITEAGIAVALDLNQWPAVPGETCSYCQLRCDVADQARMLPVRLTTEREAQQALGEYLVLTRAAAARRQALDGWCTWHGPVSLNGITIGHQPAERQRFPVDEVLRVFKEHDLQPKLTVSKSEMRPYLTQRRYAQVAPKLEPLAITKTSNELRVRKTGDVAPAIEEESHAV